MCIEAARLGKAWGLLATHKLCGRALITQMTNEVLRYHVCRQARQAALQAGLTRPKPTAEMQQLTQLAHMLMLPLRVLHAKEN